MNFCDIGVDMLCSDKTGTLTASKLSLNDPYIAPDVDPNWFMTVGPFADFDTYNFSRFLSYLGRGPRIVTQC